MEKSTKVLSLIDIFGKPRYDLITKQREYRETPEMCQFLDNVKRIGEGGFGQVYVGKVGNEKIAIKSFKNKRGEFDDYADIDVPTRLSHPFLLKVYSVITPENCDIRKSAIMSTMDYYPYDLKKAIQDNLDLDVEFIEQSCMQALEFLHHCQILHLDIKPSNILYEHKSPEYPRGRPILADFGLSVYTTLGHANYIGYPGTGTMAFIFPGILMKEKEASYDEKSDIWALGFTLASVRLKEDISSLINKEVDKVKVKNENRVFEKINRQVAKILVKNLPVMYEHMIGEKLLPIREIMRRYEIKRLDGSVIVEDDTDLDPSNEQDYLQAFNILVSKDYSLDLYFSTIHLIYLSFKANIDCPVKDRVYFCTYIVGCLLNKHEVDVPGSKTFTNFRSQLLEYTKGSLKTFNPGDYIRTEIDYYTIGKIPSRPLTYFSELAKLTYKLPPREKFYAKSYRRSFKFF